MQNPVFIINVDCDDHEVMSSYTSIGKKFRINHIHISDLIYVAQFGQTYCIPV